jgi:hypothetical protein
VNRRKYRLDIQRLTRHQKKRTAEENSISNYFVDFKDKSLSIKNDVYHRCNKRFRLRSRIIEIFVSTFLEISNELSLLSRQNVHQIADHRENQNETREFRSSRLLLETFF